PWSSSGSADSPPIFRTSIRLIPASRTNRAMVVTGTDCFCTSQRGVAEPVTRLAGEKNSSVEPTELRSRQPIAMQIWKAIQIRVAPQHRVEMIERLERIHLRLAIHCRGSQ